MRRPIGLLLSLLVLSVSGATLAQERPAAADHGGSAVDAHVRRGRSAGAAGRWAEAEAAYKAALVAADAASITEAQRAEIVGEIGLSELALRKYRDAAEHLADSLSHRAALSPWLRPRFDDGRRRAEAHVFRLYLSVSPSDADVLIDGRPLGKHGASHELFLEPGRHTVRARMEGYGDAVDTFSAPAGEPRTLSLQLPRARQASVVTAPAPVRAPAAASPVAKDEGGGVAEKLRLGGIILTAATAVAGGVSLGWSLAVHGDILERRSELRRKGWGTDACSQPDAPAECDELRSRQERRNLLAGAGLASLAASGAIGVVTLASFGVAQGDPARDGRLRVVALAGRQSGVMVQGVW